MPFKSKQQAKFMFAKKPKLAKEFASKTPSIAKLPKYSSKGTKTKLANAASKAFGGRNG